MKVEYLGYINGADGKIADVIMVNVETLEVVRIPLASVEATLRAGKRIYGLRLDGNTLVAEHGSLKKDFNEYVDGRAANGMYIDYINATSLGNKVIVNKMYIVNGVETGYTLIAPWGVQAEGSLSLVYERFKGSILNGTISKAGFKGYYDDYAIEAKEIKKENKLGGTWIIQKSEENRFSRKVMPLGNGESMLDKKDASTGLTVLEKMTAGMMNIRSTFPYYYTVLTCLNREETLSLETLGVTLDTLHFNPMFVMLCTLEELTFILMHEACHVVMMHHQRQMNRDAEVWNYACDFYVNRFIVVETNMKNGKVSLHGVGNRGIEITLPRGVLYEETVDVDNDTPESIYTELMQNMQNQNSKQSKNGNGQGGQGQNQSGQNQNGQNQNGQNQNGQNQNGQNKGSNQNNSNGSQNGNSQANSGNNAPGSGNGSTGGGSRKTSFRGKEYNIGNNNMSGNGGHGNNGNSSSMNGGDIVEDSKSSQMTQRQKEQAQKSMNRRIKQTAIQNGTSSRSSGRGDGAGRLERTLEESLVEKVDWRKVFRKMLSTRYEKVTSFSSPDRRFIGRGMILPGDLKYEDNGITKVGIYIDTSGSIGDKDLFIALTQAKDLMTQYHAKATVAFWDTEVYTEQEFEDPKDLLKARIEGGGGTEINCVFEHIEKAEKLARKTGKGEKKDIILIWTDGYFGTPNARFEKMFGKRTVFIVNEDNSFKEPFGKKAYFKKRA